MGRKMCTKSYCAYTAIILSHAHIVIYLGKLSRTDLVAFENQVSFLIVLSLPQHTSKSKKKREGEKSCDRKATDLYRT